MLKASWGDRQRERESALKASYFCVQGLRLATIEMISYFFPLPRWNYQYRILVTMFYYVPVLFLRRRGLYLKSTPLVNKILMRNPWYHEYDYCYYMLLWCSVLFLLLSTFLPSGIITELLLWYYICTIWPTFQYNYCCYSYFHYYFNGHFINGHSRILKWRYCTI